jgi:hypothetical protein
MIPNDNKNKTPVITPTLHKDGGTSKDIRQEQLDQLMESIENGFPGFYQALALLAEEHKSGPSNR